MRIFFLGRPILGALAMILAVAFIVITLQQSGAEPGNNVIANCPKWLTDVHKKIPFVGPALTIAAIFAGGAILIYYGILLVLAGVFDFLINIPRSIARFFSGDSSKEFQDGYDTFSFGTDLVETATGLAVCFSGWFLIARPECTQQFLG